MTNISDVVGEIQTEVAKVTGVKQAPQYPPDSLGEFPFAVAYMDSGEITGESYYDLKELHNVIVEIHLAREGQLLPDVIEDSIVFIDRVPQELWKSLMDGEFSKFETFGAVTYETAAMVWGGINTFGIRFTIENLKVRTALS